MQVRDWMSPDPVTVTRDTTVEDARRIISVRGVRHLPVVDAGGALVGMVSDRDILAGERVGAAGEHHTRPRGEPGTVAAIMSHPVHSISEDASMTDAARAMLSRRINAVPVVGEGKLLGLVTSSDCLLALLETGKEPEDRSSTASEKTPGSRRIDELDVDQCMALLPREQLGRLAFVREGHPDLLPLNYRWHAGSVIVRIGYGDLLDTIHRHEATFEADGTDAIGRWSVIVRGQAEEVWQTDEIAELDELGLQPWAPGTKDHYVRITPTRITGRVIR